MNLQTLLAAIHADPGDDLAWSAIADCLEEHGEAERAELTRLTHLLRRSIEVPDRPAREARLQNLLASGVEPCVAEITNSIGMRLVFIPPGEFLMGSTEEEEGRGEDEGPRHRVKISKAFYLGVYAVTQEEYEKVMEGNPSHFSATGKGRDEVQGLDTSRIPVDMVSWEDAVAFCEKLSACEKGRRYRLPTEAEWEYACRAGTTTATHHGNSLSSEHANFNGRHPYGKAKEGPYLKRPPRGGQLYGERFRPVRHARQRLGVVFLRLARAVSFRGLFRS